MSDAAGTAYRPVHYIAGVCTALYMKGGPSSGPAKNGGGDRARTSRRIFTRKPTGFPRPMDGVCNRLNMDPEKDHRGSLKVRSLIA